MKKSDKGIFRIPSTWDKKTAIVVDPEPADTKVQIAELMPHVPPGSAPVSGTSLIYPRFLNKDVDGDGINPERRSVGIKNYYSINRFYSNRDMCLKELDDVLIEFIDGDPQKPFLHPIIILRRLPDDDDDCECDCCKCR